jgi:hypothetical protein
MFSKDYFTFVGHLALDTMTQENYGGGTYTLDGEKYVEDVIYHSGKSYIGTKVRILMEIRHDTLIQRWPVDENWKLAEKYSTEKYVRVK